MMYQQSQQQFANNYQPLICTTKHNTHVLRVVNPHLVQKWVYTHDDDEINQHSSHFIHTVSVEKDDVF